jgi:hypothetical protein
VAGGKAGSFRSTCLSTFFFASNFFRPSSRSARRKFGNATQPGKKGAGAKVDHLYQLPTGRWMNFLVNNPEPTPYSDAHDYVLSV